MTDRRLVWIGVAAIAVVLAVTVVAVWAFESGSVEPGSGTGTTLTTP